MVDEESKLDGPLGMEYALDWGCYHRRQIDIAIQPT